MNARELMQELIREAHTEKHYWKLNITSTPDSEYDRLKIQRTFSIMGKDKLAQEVTRGNNPIHQKYKDVHDFDYLINGLCASIKEDIKDCTLPELHELLNELEIGMMPTGLAQAYCINKNRDGQQITGNVICINQGLYFCLLLIAKALIVESTKLEKKQNDYNCSFLFGRAIEMLLKPNSKDIDYVFFRDVPPEIDGELSAYQGKNAMIILQFIALHEFAHIRNNDLDLLDAYSQEFYGRGHYNESLQNWADKFVTTEFLADAGAMSALNYRSQTAKAAWANFSAIALFFFWLDKVEDVYGRPLSQFHPKPMTRYHALQALMIEQLGADEDVMAYIDDINQLTNKWRNNFVKQG